MTIDNWINLLNAAGTLTAVVVAVGLASASTRKAKESATVVAKLAAAGIIARLTRTLDMVGGLKAQCVFMNLNTTEDVSRIQTLSNVRHKLQGDYYRPDGPTLVALTELPAHAAHRIASAFDYLESVKLQLAALGSGLISDLTTAAQRQRLHEEVSSDVGTAYDLLQVSLRECVAARDLGAPLPTGEELHGDRES